jgi:hypothetical protein
MPRGNSRAAPQRLFGVSAVVRAVIRPVAAAHMTGAVVSAAAGGLVIAAALDRRVIRAVVAAAALALMSRAVIRAASPAGRLRRIARLPPGRGGGMVFFGTGACQSGGA